MKSVLWTLLLLLMLVPTSQCKNICCRDIGCFDITKDHVMGHLPMPNCPEDINLYFILMTRDIRGFDNKISADNVPANYDPKKLTIFMSHGWFGQSNMGWQNDLIDKLLEKYDANLIVADWKRGSMKVIYPRAAANVLTVGTALGHLMLDLANTTGVAYDNMWCMGFSLGAHVCGWAGMVTGGRLGRATGLDPAGQKFRGMGTDKNGINPTSAQFVDIVHADGGGIISYYGMIEPRGHADFYPNGGRDQPGCYFGRKKRELHSLNGNANGYPDYDAWNEHVGPLSPYNIFIACDHYRAVYYYLDTFDHADCHVAKQICTGVGKDMPKTCEMLEEPAVMGPDVDPKKHGKFYLVTGSKSPYCKY